MLSKAFKTFVKFKTCYSSSITKKTAAQKRPQILISGHNSPLGRLLFAMATFFKLRPPTGLVENFLGCLAIMLIDVLNLAMPRNHLAHVNQFSHIVVYK